MVTFSDLHYPISGEDP